ncbi:uncharacterized protein LOC119731922 isoform X4 [Patiria miniata]|uniref:PDZ domain-containing protein n=1 Tax=Patiria miniata TaxID=46514 RepID=A0A914ACE7_PATMI|nr:uncharacterized protein LOC119731922 isoform X4 [Patiria miniata]
MAKFTAVLEGGTPWGFRLKGGRGTGLPLVVSKINPGSKASVAQISVGDTVESINGQPTNKLDQNDAQNLIRSAASRLELALSRPPPLNGPVINNNNNNMSAQTSSSVSGQQNVSNFAVDDETVSVDGVTFHGFSPSNVSVTRTTTTKVTKTTRSRSPSPVRGRSSSSENLTVYPGKQVTMRYDSEPEGDAPPVKFMSGVIWTPPGSKVRNTDSDYCTCDETAPSPIPTRTTPGHSTKECSHITSRPPRPREPATQRREPGKPKRHRSSFFIRPRSRSSDASRKAATPWKPVNFQPRSKDDTAKYAFSSPPVPPPPPESDTEDVPPVVPPKPKVVKRKLYLSANQPRPSPEILIKPVTNGRVRKTSRGAEMFHKRQTQQGLAKDTDSPEEPPPPRMLATNNNDYPSSQYPTSPEQSYNPIQFSMSPSTQSAPYAQSPPKQDGYHQPVRPQRADSSPSHNPHYVYDSSGDSWPAPPPPVASPTSSQPLHVEVSPGPGMSPPKPAAWSPRQSNPSSYQPIDNKSPAAWSPASAAPVKGFKPVKLDLNPKPKPWKPPGASQPEKVNEPAPTSSSQHPTWHPPPPASQAPPQQPVPNGDLHSPYRPPERQPSSEGPSSPYRPADHDQDRQRYNPAYQQQPRQQGWPSEPRSPQETRKPEFRQVPDGYSSGLPRPVSPTVTLLRNQREREKDHRSHADYLPPDSSLMPPSLVAKAPSGVAKQPVAVAKPLHAGTYMPVITDPNDLPEGAVFQKQTIDGDVIHTDTYYPVKTREVTKKTVHKEAPQYEGIGPQDETGLPIGLRANVKEENRHDWYKEMFKTIHKQDRPEDEIDQTYLDALIQEANTYEPSYGFPDAVDVKDNDQWGHDPTLDVSPPRSPPHRHHSPNTSARNTIDRYHQQPRSIIDYEPGRSSLAEREKSPTAQLYNPPIEPISAVQNTKRSTTLPRDFAQFSQVPTESPSARHLSPKQGTIPSIFSTNPNPSNQTASDDSPDSVNFSCETDCLLTQCMIPLATVRHLEFQPLDYGADYVSLNDKKDHILQMETAQISCSKKIYHHKISDTEEHSAKSPNHLTESHRNHEDVVSLTYLCHELPHKMNLTESNKVEYFHGPPPGVFRKPRVDLGGAPTPIRPVGAAQSEPAAHGNESVSQGHSIGEQVDNASNGNGEPPVRYGPRGMADGCSEVDQSGIVCQLNANGQVTCLDCDTGENFEPRLLPRPTSLFEPYSLEREQERSASRPSSSSPRRRGIPLDIASGPAGSDSANIGLPNQAQKSPISMDTQSDKSGPSVDGDHHQEVQKPGSLSPDQLTAEGEQKHKRNRIGAKHQKLKHIKKHRSEKHSPKDEDSDMVPYSERPNARNFAPMDKRRAMSAENLSLAVKSPAFNQESYQKYATGLRKASQQSKTYDDLVKFYSEVNRHLEKEEKEKAETMKEKYLPKPAQLETFYRTLQYFLELEMAVQCGEDMIDRGKKDGFIWHKNRDVGLKKKEKDIFELYDFFEKLERGAIGTPTTEQRLEQIRMQTYLQKAKELEARQLRVGQLYEWYENIECRGSTTPSIANSQVASLVDLDDQGDGVPNGLPPSCPQNIRPASESKNAHPKVDLSLEELESLIPRVPMVDPPLESFPNRHRPLGNSSTLPRLYTKRDDRAWSPVPMPSIELSREDKSKAEDEMEDKMDDFKAREEVTRETISSLAQPPASILDAGRKTPPFMMTGRPSPVTRRRSFDKAISGIEGQEEPEDEPDTGSSKNNSSIVRKGPENLIIPIDSDVSNSQKDSQVTPPASPREEVVRPGSPEACAPPKLPERSMSTGVLGIRRVIGSMYNPTLGRLQRWNRADLSQIEDEDSLPDEEIPSPAESRTRAPPIGRVGKMQSDSSLPTMARGAGKSLDKNGMKKFTQSQNELGQERGWGNFNASPQPFKRVNQIKSPIKETDQDSSLSSFDLEPLESLVANDQIDDLPATLDPFSRVQQQDEPQAAVKTPQFQASLDHHIESESLTDSSSELDHKSKIQLFEEKIVEQRSTDLHRPVPLPPPQKKTSVEPIRVKEENQSEVLPAIHVRNASEDKDVKSSSFGHGGLVIGIFSKPQPKQEEEIPNWPPTPSPQQEFYTPPGDSYLTQSLPHNFHFSLDEEKPGMLSAGVVDQLRSTSASADCSGVDWGKKLDDVKSQKLDQPERVIKRYAFSTDEVYEERTPVSSRNVSPLPPSFSRYGSDADRHGKTDVDRSRITHDDAQVLRPSPLLVSPRSESHEEQTPVASRNITPVPPALARDIQKREIRDDAREGQIEKQAVKSFPMGESTHYQSYPLTKQGLDSLRRQNDIPVVNSHLHNDVSKASGFHLDLKDLDLTDGNPPDSPNDTYTPSCSYSPSPTPSQDFLEDDSSKNRWYLAGDTSQGVPRKSRQRGPSSHWPEPELENVFYWDTYVPNKYMGDAQSDATPEQRPYQDSKNLNSKDLTPTNDWSESYSTLQALSPEPPKYEAPSTQNTHANLSRADYQTGTRPEYPKQKSVQNPRPRLDPPRTNVPQNQAKSSPLPRAETHSEPPPKYPRGHPVDKSDGPIPLTGYQSPRALPLFKGDALVPQKSSTLPQQRKSPRMKEEPIRSPSSRPLSSTLPRAKSKSRSLESSGLSAAERLGIKTPPPKRTPSTGSKPSRHSSGSDKIYNYRDPPPTLDKTKAEKLIEEERKKKERLQAEEQKQRRHSDYAPIKSPIITNERFRDPVISAADDGRKQEVKACAIALYPFKAQNHKELSFSKGDIIYLLRKIDQNWFEGEHHGHAGIFPSSYVEVVTSLEDAKKAQLHGPGLEGKARAKYKFSGETQMELSFSKGEYIVLIKKIDANWWEGNIGDRKGIFPAAYVEVLREPTGVASSPAKKTQPATSHSPYQPPAQHMVQSSPKHQQRPQAVPSHQPGRSSHGSSGSQGSYGGSQREPERYFEEPVPKPSRTLAAGQDLFVASFAYIPQNEDEIELLEGDLVNVLEKCDDGWYVGMSERTGMFGTFPGNYVYKRET